MFTILFSSFFTVKRCGKRRENVGVRIGIRCALFKAVKGIKKINKTEDKKVYGK